MEEEEVSGKRSVRNGHKDGEYNMQREMEYSGGNNRSRFALGSRKGVMECPPPTPSFRSLVIMYQIAQTGSHSNRTLDPALQGTLSDGGLME